MGSLFPEGTYIPMVNINVDISVDAAKLLASIDWDDTSLISLSEACQQALEKVHR